MHGEIIKKELERTGITQKELAKKIFVTPQAVSKWINNQSRPSIENVIAMSKIFEVDMIKALIGETIKETKPMESTIRIEDVIDTSEKANLEAKKILETMRIEEHYSYSVCKMLEWLITATFGLSYHHYVLMRMKNKEYEYDYYNVFLDLADYFEPCYSYRDQYRNELQYKFYLMGMDFFESFEPYLLPNHDYCRDSMRYWYNFDRVFSWLSEGELKVALSEILAHYN